MLLVDGSVWTVHGELLAANVVRLSWTTRDFEMSSAFSDVGDRSQRVSLRSAGLNSTLEAVRLLNGTSAACADDDRGASLLLISCNITDSNNNVMPILRYYTRLSFICNVSLPRNVIHMDLILLHLLHLSMLS